MTLTINSNIINSNKTVNIVMLFIITRSKHSNTINCDMTLKNSNTINNNKTLNIVMLLIVT